VQLCYIIYEKLFIKDVKGEMDVIVFFVYHVFNNHGVEIEICCAAQWGSQISGWAPKLFKLGATLAPKKKS
jgi:hypothetical protein